MRAAIPGSRGIIEIQNPRCPYDASIRYLFLLCLDTFMIAKMRAVVGNCKGCDTRDDQAA